MTTLTVSVFYISAFLIGYVKLVRVAAVNDEEAPQPVQNVIPARVAALPLNGNNQQPPQQPAYVAASSQAPQSSIYLASTQAGNIPSTSAQPQNENVQTSTAAQQRETLSTATSQRRIRPSSSADNQQTGVPLVQSTLSSSHVPPQSGNSLTSSAILSQQQTTLTSAATQRRNSRQSSQLVQQIENVPSSSTPLFSALPSTSSSAVSPIQNSPLSSSGQHFTAQDAIAHKRNLSSAVKKDEIHRLRSSRSESDIPQLLSADKSSFNLEENNALSSALPPLPSAIQGKARKKSLKGKEIAIASREIQAVPSSSSGGLLQRPPKSRPQQNATQFKNVRGIVIPKTVQQPSTSASAVNQPKNIPSSLLDVTPQQYILFSVIGQGAPSSVPTQNVLANQIVAPPFAVQQGVAAINIQPIINQPSQVILPRRKFGPDNDMNGSRYCKLGVGVVFLIAIGAFAAFIYVIVQVIKRGHFNDEVNIRW